MSAIAGICFLDGQPVDVGTLEQMGATLAHRGPDESGIWTSESVGFVHRMLHTTPESLRERMPRAHQLGDLAVTADIRIDNRAELIDTLGLAHRAPEEISDSELLLAAYQQWGENCPSRLMGDFAFAIWDGRRRSLFCARDPMGVKPFYYHHRHRRLFAFASEIKAIFCIRDLPRRINELKVADHLTLLFEDATSTFFQDIFRLPAAHSLSVTTEGIRIQRYWALDKSKEIRLKSDWEYAEAFREVFTEAVRCRLRSAFPVGSTLSGGLDSSSITCTARQVLTEQGRFGLHSLSAIFPNLPESDMRMIDERKYVDAILASGGLETHFVEADRISPLIDVQRTLWHADEPVNTPNLYIHMAMYRVAQENGIRVFLDGLDGDTTVSHGLGYLPELALTGKWRTLLAEARALAQMSPNSGFTSRRIIRDYAIRPLAPDFAVNVWRLLRRSPDPTGVVDPIVNPSFAKRLDLAERARSLRRSDAADPRSSREAHWRALTSALYPYVLEIADKAASIFSLESRYPFFDRRLIEFCLSLPPEQKLNKGWTRIVLRRAMNGILPDEVQWRVSKANLSRSFQRGLIEHEKSTMRRVLSKDGQTNCSRQIEAYVDMVALRGALERYEHDPIHRGQDALTVYRVLTLALWLEQIG